VASAADTYNAVRKQVSADLTGHHEVAICVGGAGGGGPGGVVSGCVGNTGNGTPFASFTAGGGGSSPSGSLGASVQVSNAKTPNDLRGAFGYEGASADLGLSAGGSGFEGNGSQNQGIVGGEGGVGIGLDLPIPFEFHGGVSYTWTTPN
jgi:hypothetical protein